MVRPLAAWCSRTARDGGLVAFEMLGPREGWTTLGEQVGSAAGRFASLAFLMVALSAIHTLL